MSDTAAAIETIGFVARSACRAEILAALASDGCLSRANLRDRFDVSRTTVGRNITALEDRELIRRTNGGYVATHTGKAVAASFGDLVETVEVTTKLESIVQWLPDEGFDPDIASLADVELTLAGEGDPYAPVNRHEESLRAIEEGRALLAVTGLSPMRTLAERVEEGATFEAVVEPDVAETFRSNPSYADCYETLVDTGRFALSVADEPIPYSVVLLDDTVQVGLEDDDGLPRALLESDSAALREWGIAVYERYERDAERLV